MQRRTHQPRLVDRLEARTVLSMFGFGGDPGYGFGMPPAITSAAVQADQAKIQADQQTYQTDQIDLATTLLLAQARAASLYAWPFDGDRVAP